MEDYKKYLPMTLETRDSYDLWLKYDDEYLVSVTSHRVKALNYHKRGIVYELVPRIYVQKSSIGQVAYAYVSIHGKTKSVHSLIIETIHGKLQKGFEIDHINTDGTDNYLPNLRICETHLENMQNPLTVQHHVEGCRKRSQNPEWQRNNTEKGRKLAQDPEWQKRHSEAMSKLWNQEHRENQADKMRNLMSRPVDQMTPDGQFVKRWSSTREAARQTGINQSNISACCNGDLRYHLAGGFKWVYCFSAQHKTNRESLKKKLSKTVLQYDKEMNLIAEYPSISEASRITSVNCANISECCRNKRNTAGDYIWRFA